MPSKSAKQHRFMEAVAHNPSFAKKAGVPVSVGKHFHNADKQMKRKFAEGGMPPPTPPSKPVDSKVPEKPKAPKGMTDNEREARSEREMFKMAHPKFKKGGSVKRKNKFAEGGAPEDPGASDIAKPDISDQKMPLNKDLMSFGQAFHEARKSGDKTFTWKGKSYGTELAKTKPNSEENPNDMGEVTVSANRKDKPYTTAADLPSYSRRPTAPTPKPASKIKYPISKTGSAVKGGFGSDYKKGGEIESKVANYFAKKGEKGLAAHEKRESEGKEEDTKSIAKKEERVLKGAPKPLRDYEKKEHKDMGFKKGGKIKKFSKPSKARAPSVDPAALMAQMAPPSAPTPDAMGGGMPPMGGGMPPMGGGMKKGGHVIQHHHHYAKGGSIGKGVERKGSTKVKMVKMASGGHVGSHPARRADGIAQKGRTRCKVC